MADLAAAGKRLPPIPLMGAGFIPVGVSGLIMLFVIPELMAARHIAEPVIAAVTALGLLPGFLSFLLAPLLDWRFSRRVWALLFTSLTVAASFVALMVVGDPGLLAAALFVSGLASALSAAAVGGWFGSIVPERDKARLGAWFTVGNFGAGGIVAAVGLPLLHAISYPVGAAVLALGNLLVVPLLFWTPCPAADGRLASESFAAFARDVAAILGKPIILLTLLLFILPAASFALTNTLPSLGGDFHASAVMVGLIGGVGVSSAGVLGSLLVPPLAGRVAPRPLYLSVGAAGAAFTLVLLLMPRTPAIFALAIIGETIFQAAAFSVQNAIILRTIAPASALAATQFGLLSSVAILPLAYMQVLDGAAYGAFDGLVGAFFCDAFLSGGACLLLAFVLLLLRGRPSLAAPALVTPEAALAV